MTKCKVMDGFEFSVQIFEHLVQHDNNRWVARLQLQMAQAMLQPARHQAALWRNEQDIG